MNQFGQKYRISIFGESHGSGVGLTLDGIPPGIPLSVEDFTEDILRRKAGAKGTTPRIEADSPTLLSGIFNGFTTGAPLTIFFENTNTRSKDYSKLKTHHRPGHADFTANSKYKGFQDFRGGGHFSGRLTLCLVAAGVVAKKILGESLTIEARLIEAGGNHDIKKAIDNAIIEQESIGGIIECIATGLPVGLGEPFFDSIESKIAQLVFAIPATKGVEFGSGFQAAKMKGSEHNDNFIDDKGTTETNNAGGINGGISNGNPLVFRVAIKPTSSIFKGQETFNSESGQVEELKIVGRHDVCIALRAPVVVEAIAAIALADFKLIG